MKLITPLILPWGWVTQIFPLHLLNNNNRETNHFLRKLRAFYCASLNTFGYERQLFNIIGYYSLLHSFIIWKSVIMGRMLIYSKEGMDHVCE